MTAIFRITGRDHSKFPVDLTRSKNTDDNLSDKISKQPDPLSLDLINLASPLSLLNPANPASPLNPLHQIN